MKQYQISGMSCAACASRVEKAVSKVEGVTQCSVSLLTNSMAVEGEPDEQVLFNAVSQAGYGISSFTQEDTTRPKKQQVIEDTETPVLIRRLIASVGVLVILMYCSMGHQMLGFPLPALLEKSEIALGIIELLLSGIIMVINQKFFIRGFGSAMHFAPNMDTLVAMGSGVSFLYSVWMLLRLCEASVNHEAVMHVGHGGFYFETAAMIVTLITVGKTLEAYSKGKTTSALKSLMELAPQTATLEINGVEQVVGIEQVKIDDVFVVRAGESIPVDGVILEGSCAVDESALTGESLPVDKVLGDCVSAATISCSGFIKCKAMRVGKDTTLSQIIQMVSDASATKAPIAKIADRVSGIFVPIVLGIALLTFVVWSVLGVGTEQALSYAIAVLVISCPCSLGLATPVAIMVGNGRGAKLGILFKTAAALEETGRISIVALDKTGTITQGNPSVMDVVCVEETNRQRLLQLAYSLEKNSEHPLAKAVCKAAEEKAITPLSVQSYETLAGSGVKGEIEGTTCYVGNEALVAKHCVLPDGVKEQMARFSQEGKTPLLFVMGSQLLGILTVADAVKSDSVQAISQLKEMGLRVVMLTGDNPISAKAIAKSVGIDEVIAQVLPSGKEAVIEKLQKEGKVAMVGDGINDAPALTRAEVGIAIGAGTDVAVDAADVVLMNSKLMDVAKAICLSRATLRNIHENLFWAFFYNSIGIPVAAGVFAKAFGVSLNPMLGALAMSLSSVCVVCNALRLNLIPLNFMKEGTVKRMEQTIKIEGMMCGHCEARVKAVLEAIDGVEEAIVSHETGTAHLQCSKEVDGCQIKEAIEAQGYQVKA